MPFLTRREVLAGLGKGILGLGVVNSLRPAFSFADLGQPAGGARYVVIVRLAGGLDPLGAFPFVDSAHASAILARRPRIGAPATVGLLDNGTGLAMNSALAPLYSEFTAQRLKIVYGVGNRSFTLGLDLSHAFNQNFQAGGGSPRGGLSGRGYLAQARDVYHLDVRQVMGIGVNGGAELAHPDATRKPISVADLSQLDFPVLDSQLGGATETDLILSTAQRLRELHAARLDPHSRTRPIVSALDTMDEMAAFFRSINSYSVAGLFDGYTSSSLGKGLVGIAKTIGSLDSTGQSKIFLSGYQSAEWDTHNDQRNALQTNLNDLGTNLAALVADLKSLGNGIWQRTTVVTISEFGRRIYENGTGGTDHGTGGASMVLGGSVQGGVVIDPSVASYAWSTQHYVPVAVHFQNVLAQPLRWMGFEPDLLFAPEHYTATNLDLFSNDSQG